jgi:hypothetical protein
MVLFWRYVDEPESCIAQTERGYRKAWTYHRLRTRWGDETLAEFGVVQDSFQ